MRIAMVAACPFPSPQGSQVFIGQMCERLAARGHDVHLLTYGEGREVVGGGYRHHRVRRLPGDTALRSGPTPLKPLLDGLMVVALDRLLGSHRFDVVHCHNYEATMIGVAVRARRGVPVVYHSHNMMGDELATYFNAAVTRLLARGTGRLLDATVPRAANHVIALCEVTGAQLLRLGVSRRRLSIIPPAVDDDGPALASSLARGDFGLASLRHDALVVGYCGNLDGYQNLDLLLDGVRWAAGMLGRRHIVLLVASHARDRSFERAVSAHSLARNTRFVVVRDYAEARRAMEAADVLVLPRRHGSGYPIKLLNYMSLGRPIVTAGCGAKALRPGIEALVVGDDDAPALGRALCSLADDPDLARGLGEAARKRFLADLCWRAVLPAIEGAYAKALALRDDVAAARAV